jgi:AraC-like DNA-binding protein
MIRCPEKSMAVTYILLTKTIMPDSIDYIGGAHVRFHQSLYLRRRLIENYRFLFVESGSGEFVFGDETLAVEERMFLLLSPGIRETRYYATREVSYAYVEFKADALLLNGPYLSHPVSSPHFQTLVWLLRSILKENGAAARLLPAALELVQLHPAHSESTPAPDDRIRRVLHFIEINLSRPIQIPELALEAGVSEAQFRRIFRAAMSIGPKEYLLRERMDHARRMMQSESLRVGEVADLLQFETVYQFSNQYKKVHGHSPTQDSHFPR